MNAMRKQSKSFLDLKTVEGIRCQEACFHGFQTVEVQRLQEAPQGFWRVLGQEMRERLCCTRRRRGGGGAWRVFKVRRQSAQLVSASSQATQEPIEHRIPHLLVPEETLFLVVSERRSVHERSVGALRKGQEVAQWKGAADQS